VYSDQESNAGIGEGDDPSILSDNVVPESQDGFDSTTISDSHSSTVLATPTATSAVTSPRPGWRHVFDSLGNRDFLLLWLGMLSMMGAYQMQTIAQGFLVYDITGSASILGLVSAGWALPMLVLSLFGGAIADRVERKPLIQVGQSVSAVISLMIAVSITTGIVTWVHLLAGSMIQGAMFAFQGPARQAIIPQIVGQDRITNAIALNSAAMSSMSLIAPGVAGVLYAILGPEGVYYIMAGMGLMSLALTSAIHKPPRPPERDKSAVLQDIKVGIAYLFADRTVLLLLLIGLITALLSMPFQFLLPVFVVNVYGMESEAFGLLVSMMGLGSLFGALFIASMGQWRRGMLLILGGFLSGLSLMLVSLVPIYFAAVGILVVLGIGNTAPMTLNVALIMERTENEYRGRMMSIVMMMWGLMPVGVMPLSIAYDAIGGRATVAMMAIAILVIYSIVLFTRKDLRGLQ